MHKILLVVILFLSFNCARGQSFIEMERKEADSIFFFYTSKGDTINGHYKDDILNNGKFRQYRKQYYRSPFFDIRTSNNKNEENNFVKNYKYDSRTDLLVEGEYADGKRNGSWIFWADCGSKYSSCIPVYITHTIAYRGDTMVYNEVLKGKYITYIHDSSIITGKVINSKGRNIDFHCQDSSCIFWQTNKSQVIATARKVNFADTLDELTIRLVD